MKLLQLQVTYSRILAPNSGGSDRIEANLTATLDEGEEPSAALAVMLTEVKKPFETGATVADPAHAEIVFVRRDVTQRSASPLYRCATQDGRTVNIFQHSDPAKDNFHLFEQAGYADALLSLKEIGDSQNWGAWPIAVTVVFDGRFWNIQGVTQRPDGAVPDAEESALAKLRAASKNMAEAQG